ncbi:MAG: hypothetical protein EOO10_14225 [Chitinophagaceae bacterium]|nr:MAG: hypothetical protein EOO10_14225 [Chitinophagaceae bacterium]
MATKNTMTPRLLLRFFAGGILLGMITVYLLHFLGTWEVGSERPDSETTSTVIVTNQCAVLGDTHILRPTSSLTTNKSVRELKFAGSFMNFFDGHIVAMVLIASVVATIIVFFKKANSSPSSPSYS